MEKNTAEDNKSRSGLSNLFLRYLSKIDGDMMNELLQASTKVIAKWLESKLPLLGTDWWGANVVARLTFQQQRLVDEKSVQSLDGLDLAAVLRVLDQNWSELSGAMTLPREARNWIKELQSVRNRWAHTPAGGLNDSDIYRDVDTLERLVEVLGAEDLFLDQVAQTKATVLARLSPQGATEAKQETASISDDRFSVLKTTDANKFLVGQILCLKSNPSAIFPVIEILQGVGVETRYRVFEGRSRQVYYESQLQAIDDADGSFEELSAGELSAMLTAVLMSSPTASSLYSLNSGRVRFVPYQYRPVLKLIRADRPRLLVADEVGVGKTIEAGLIIKELQARSDIKSVLIICPKSLVAERKWEQEMKRFDETFTPLDGALLRHCIKETHLGGEWPVQYEKAIVPTSLFDNDLLFGKVARGKSRDIGLLDLDPPPKFDLVIVDEAHHIRNPETFLHQAVRYFADNAEAVVFLSATPVQLGREDLYTLLNVLRPDVIIDPASFAQMAEPNPYINIAIQACRRGDTGWTEDVREQLRVIAGTTWGREVLASNPGFQHIYDGLAEDVEDGVARINTTYALEELYTFSSLINRTRRRDIGEFTTRKAETLTIEFTANQKVLHDGLLDVIARVFSRLHGNQNVRFMMTTICRQAASSLYGLAPALRDILGGKLARLETELDSESIEEHSLEFIDQIRGDIESLVHQAAVLDSFDPKADAFLKVVIDKLGMPRNKILVFSTFRHTLKYLESKLKNSHVRFGLVHGSVSDEERASLRHRFSMPKENEDALDVLLSSEVGCEGLDFQFCDCLINFDLPWNPMRIEQRIGRIDRYGQQSETVRILNFVTPGTIDAEIYNRCLSRIGVFQHAIGGNEEILGDITKELNSIAETFDLSDEERKLRLQQLADNKIRQIQEEERLEEVQGEFFGLNLAAASWEKRLKESRNYWLEPNALAVAVTTYLSLKLGKDQEFLLGDKPVKTLRLSLEARASILEDFRKLPRSTEPTYRAWEKWLKGSAPTLSVTFEQGAAVENSSAVLISIGHPLLRQATGYLQQDEVVNVRLSVSSNEIPAGIHPFALYRWAKQGVRKDEVLVPVAKNFAIADKLLETLVNATHAPMLDFPSQQTWEELDAEHHQRWLRESTQHSEDNSLLVGVRIQSLSASFSARRVHLSEQILKATNEKIRLMKQAELDRATVDFEVRSTALQKAADSGDIRATPIVYGVLEVRGEK